MYEDMHSLRRIRRVYIPSNVEAMLFQMPPGVTRNPIADSRLSPKTIAYDQIRAKPTEVIQVLAWNILDE